MNATKRKFNSLLQGIGAKPSSPVSSSSSSAAAANTTSTRPADSPSATRTSTTTAASSSDAGLPPLSSAATDVLKRRRLDAQGSAPSAAGSGSSQVQAPSITAPGLPTVLLRKSNGLARAPAAVDKTPITTPRYCPGDRDQLIRRLATFQELTDWTPKPDRVNELEWAKRGWVCEGKERVRCTLCNKEMVVKLNRKEVEGKEVPVLVASEIEDALVDKYVELMVTSHQDDCLWRERPCDDHLIRLGLANPAAALQDLRKRYDELCARKDFLPYEFNLRLPEKLNLDGALHMLPQTFFTDPPPPPPPSAAAAATGPGGPNRTALALALLGWQGLDNAKIGPVPNSASCHTCLRRLGLWMFKSTEVDQDTGEVLVPAMMDHLDPLREHRDFCPWKNGHVQRHAASAAASKRRPTASAAAAAANPNPAGWEVLLQVLKNDAYLRSRASATRIFGHKGSKSVGSPASSPAHQKPQQQQQQQQPTTPVRPTTSGQDRPANARLLPDDDEDDDEQEDEATRDAKDKERWARLRRVKSLFDPKGKNKLKRSQSRPATGHGSAPPPADAGQVC